MTRSTAAISPSETAGALPTARPWEPASFALSGCPVSKETFCQVAVLMANAIATGDVDEIARVSRSLDLECDQILTESFPQCSSQSTLHGYSIGGPDFMFDVLSEADYRDRLADIFSNVDLSFSDGHGGGAPEVVGIGTCGGHSYSLLWTVAVRGGSDPAGRLTASIEFINEGDGWLGGIWWIATSEEMRSLAPWADDYELATGGGCDAAESPWPTETP